MRAPSTNATPTGSPRDMAGSANLDAALPDRCGDASFRAATSRLFGEPTISEAANAASSSRPDTGYAMDAAPSSFAMVYFGQGQPRRPRARRSLDAASRTAYAHSRAAPARRRHSQPSAPTVDMPGGARFSVYALPPRPPAAQARGVGNLASARLTAAALRRLETRSKLGWGAGDSRIAAWLQEAGSIQPASPPLTPLSAAPSSPCPAHA